MNRFKSCQVMLRTDTEVLLYKWASGAYKGRYTGLIDVYPWSTNVGRSQAVNTRINLSFSLNLKK